MRTVHLLFLIATLQFVAVPSARAQPVLPPPPPWNELVRANIAEILQRAERAEQAGDMDAAIEAYEEANARGESVAVGVELGLALLRAGRTVEGARRLRWAMMLSPLPLSQRPMRYLTQRLEEARSKIGTLLIRSNVDKVSLDVDGAIHWEYPSLLEIYVEPEKEHKIRARRDGYWTAVTTEKVGAGEVKDVLMAMEPQVMQKVVNLPVHMNASVSNRPGQEEESKTLLYVSAIGVGVSLAAGITGYAVRDDAKDRGDIQAQAVGLGLLIGGGIGLGLSLTGFMVYVASRPQPQPVITISPALAKNQVGLGLQGTW